MPSIFDNLLKPEGSTQDVQRAAEVLQQAKAGIAEAVPIVQAVSQAIKLLPQGELKSWLSANPVQFWTKIISLIKGRKYTSGDYVLGERYNDNILCNPDIGRKQVSDDMVVRAWYIFTILFGVLIRTSDDLDALDFGVSAYMGRPGKQYQDLEAVKRAVYLKQNYYPSTTYNRSCWDLKYFELHPLVAPIPDPEADPNLRKYYTGPLPGGALCVNGIIPVDAKTIVDQLPTGTPFDPGTQSQPDGTPAPQSFIDKIISFAKTNPLAAGIIAAALGYVVYETVEND